MSRNVEGYPFAWRQDLVGALAVRAALWRAARPFAHPRSFSGPAARRERARLGLRVHPPEGAAPEVWWLRGRFRKGDERCVALVGAVDHLLIETVRPGLDIEGSIERALALAARIGRRVPFARVPAWGWLTASPADCGMGVRVLVRMAAGVLAASGPVPAVLAALARAGLVAGRLPGTPGIIEITHRQPLGMHPLHILQPASRLLGRLAALGSVADVAHQAARRPELFPSRMSRGIS